MATSVHQPVMLREVLQRLELTSGLTVMDGTVGAGGHSVAILRQIGTAGHILGFDRDTMMLEYARSQLTDSNVTLIHAPYSTAEAVLPRYGVTRVDRVLLDLGLSSDQLADRERGFGFDAGGELDMRFDTSVGTSCREYLMRASSADLLRVFRDYGEEPLARSIAEAIVVRRDAAGITTAEDLLRIIHASVRSPERRRDTAARVFQSLRIAVNEELFHLEKMMADVLTKILRTDGLAVILTYHSLEDRIVKSAFKGQQGWLNLTKTPLRPTPAEVRLNPRSRSARLRVARWIGP